MSSRTSTATFCTHTKFLRRPLARCEAHSDDLSPFLIYGALGGTGGTQFVASRKDHLDRRNGAAAGAAAGPPVYPLPGQICEPAGEAKVANCTSYQLLPFIVFEVAQFLDKMGGAITAVATIAIAIFTFTLKRATDKLWEAGERQLHLLGETSAAQSRDMQASIQAATDSANAAITSNQIAATNAERQLRAYVTVQDINMVTHRLADRVGTLHDNIVPGAVHLSIFRHSEERRHDSGDQRANQHKSQQI
ncbi:hypothetical protein ACFQX9_01520 [Bradyrhizobium sp. GCM10028915]|uniref:hypothetical protein n=1 Tax=Bradyrhizobium sp. GCM10028915 TaxID=3273385 RepID=UPI0036081093